MTLLVKYSYTYYQFPVKLTGYRTHPTPYHTNKNRSPCRTHTLTRNHTCAECNRKYTEQHQRKTPERRRELQKAYRKRYPEKIKASHAKHRAEKLKRVPKWLTKEDIKAIKEFYAEATRKTLATGVNYQVDHIIPLKGKHISGLHVPSNLQIITATENMQKYNVYICK
jgi:hypothetical protein